MTWAFGASGQAASPPPPPEAQSRWSLGSMTSPTSVHGDHPGGCVEETESEKPWECEAELSPKGRQSGLGSSSQRSHSEQLLLS